MDASKLNWKCAGCGSTTPLGLSPMAWAAISRGDVSGPICATLSCGMKHMEHRCPTLDDAFGCEWCQRHAKAEDFAPDMVNHPTHYNRTKIECIDAVDALVETLPAGDGYYAGAILKYIWRYPDKGGSESLKKLRWYLDRLISRVEKREASAKK